MTSTDGSDNKITYERWLDEYPNKEKYFSQLNYLVTLPQKPISEPLQAPFYFCKPILFSRYLLHNILFFFFFTREYMIQKDVKRFHKIILRCGLKTSLHRTWPVSYHYLAYFARSVKPWLLSQEIRQYLCFIVKNTMKQRASGCPRPLKASSKLISATWKTHLCLSCDVRASWGPN